MSNITAIAPIPERSDATPGLWNARHDAIMDNIRSMNTDLVGWNKGSVSTQILSSQTIMGRSIDSGGGVFDVRAFQGVGDGVTDDRLAFVSASSAANARGLVSASAGTYKIATAMTLLSAVQLQPGAVLQPASGVTLSFRRAFRAGTWQVFDLTLGGFVEFVDATAPEILPEWFGAKVDGSTDDTVAVNYAVRAAEAFMATPNTYLPRAPRVRLPLGRMRTTSAITITMPIELAGHGDQTSWIKADGVNVPAVHVSLTTTQSAYVQYELRDFGIEGPNASSNSYLTRNNQDGVRVTGTSDVGADIERVRIIGMTGNGVHLKEKGNSTVVRRCVIEACCESGVRVNGAFNTNPWITQNIIRENRIGIMFKSDAGGTLSTGRVDENLFESNTAGSTGSIGSSDRPSVAIWLYRTQGVSFRENYCENQANDVYMEESATFNTFVDNLWMFANNFTLPHLYGGPPARQMGVYIGSSSVGNIFRGNFFEARPTQGSNTSQEWGTFAPSSYGTSYEHVTDNFGTNMYHMNRTTDPSNGSVLITNPSARHVIIGTPNAAGDGAGRAEYIEQFFKRRLVMTGHEILDDDSGNHTIAHLGILGVSQRIRWPAPNAGYAVYHENTQNDGSRSTYYGRQNPFGIEYQSFATGSSSFMRIMGPAAPATGGRPDGGGFWQVGDLVWNTVPAASGVMGWVCTTSAQTASFKSFGSISA